MELEDITSTGTATFAKAIVDDMNIEDLTTQSAAFDAFYLGGSNVSLETLPSGSNAITTQTEEMEETETTPSGKLINDIDLSGFSGEYSDNHIMSSKAINELIAKNNESHNFTLNESLTNTLANCVKTDSLTTTLNDYGTKDRISNNNAVLQRKVINENNTALHSIVKLSKMNVKLNVNDDNIPKKVIIEIESNETYNGIYEYTGTGFGQGWKHYENEQSTENGYRINLRTGIVPEPIIVRDYRDNTGRTKSVCAKEKKISENDLNKIH